MYHDYETRHCHHIFIPHSQLKPGNVLYHIGPTHASQIVTFAD